MALERLYTTRRQAIIDGLVEALKKIDGTDSYLTNLYQQVSPRLKFWDEEVQFPSVHLNAGSETREYEGSGYKTRFLTITLRCYVNEEEAQLALAALLEDVETVLEENSRLKYTDRNNKDHYTQQITIVSIDTDEGVLEPFGVAEMLIEVRY